MCVLQESVEEEFSGSEQAEPLESQYPHVKRSLQQGEQGLYTRRSVFKWCYILSLQLCEETRNQGSALDFGVFFVSRFVLCFDLTQLKKDSFA